MSAFSLMAALLVVACLTTTAFTLMDVVARRPVLGAAYFTISLIFVLWIVEAHRLGLATGFVWRGAVLLALWYTGNLLVWPVIPQGPVWREPTDCDEGRRLAPLFANIGALGAVIGVRTTSQALTLSGVAFAVVGIGICPAADDPPRHLL